MRAFSRSRQLNAVLMLSFALSGCAGSTKEDGSSDKLLSDSQQNLAGHTGHPRDGKDHDSRKHWKHADEQCTFASLLSGQQEVPPRPAIALAVAAIKSSKEELRYELDVT